MAKDTVCSVEGCERRVIARGWCGKHYQRWWYHGTTALPPPRVHIKRMCSIAGCERVAVARGWCKGHYDRAQNARDMDVPFRVDHPRGPLLNEEQVREMYEGREMTMQEIADELVCPPSRVARTMKAYGISSRRAIPRSKINSGDQNPNWKGGRHMLSGTYVWIHFPAHPCANGSGYVAEHVAVAYEKYGYAAPPGHVVHHINMRHTDNRPENLVYMPKRLHHMVHRQFEQVVPILLERGILTFDLEHGYYVTGTEPKVLRWDEWRVCELEDCGKEFLVKTKRPHQRFCSVQCVAANRRGRQRTEWAVR